MQSLSWGVQLGGPKIEDWVQVPLAMVRNTLPDLAQEIPH